MIDLRKNLLCTGCKCLFLQVHFFFPYVFITIATTFANKCHEYKADKLPQQERPDWIQSKYFCSEHASHLVCIEHQGQLYFMAQKLEKLNLAGKYEYFIGLEEQRKDNTTQIFNLMLLQSNFTA